MRMFRMIPVALCVALCGTAQAQSLSALYDAARSYDASYQSAQLQHDASLAQAAQSRALMLPQVGLGIGVSHSEVDNSTPFIKYPFDTQSATLSASQPLYRPQNMAAYTQGEKQVELAAVQLTAAEQDLIARVSQAYFDVLAAQDNLVFVQAQKAAVALQLAA